jgi:hypothetical protein
MESQKLSSTFTLLPPLTILQKRSSQLFSVGLLLVSCTSLRAGASPLLATALQRWLAGAHEMAFTEHTKVLHEDGSLKEEWTERFDPSQPDARRWTLIETGGIPATRDQSAKWELKKNQKPRRKVEGSPLELFDTDHAVLVGDTPGTARYKVPMRPVMAHLVALDNIDLVVTVDKRSGNVAGIGAALREPIAVLLGLVRITDLDVNLHVNPDSGQSSRGSEELEPGSTVHMTVSKLGNAFQYDWSDFTQVPVFVAPGPRD